MAIEQKIAKVKKLYADLGLHNIDALNEIYTDDIVFVDPVNRIEGRDKLLAHFRESYADVIACRFYFNSRREIISTDNALLVWKMDLRHKKLGGGKPIEVQGSSLLELTNRGIHYHRDWFDIGEMVYEHVPVLGGLVKMVKTRLKAGGS